MKIWLLEPSIARELREAAKGGLRPTPEQQASYEARDRQAIEARDGMPRNLTVAGDVAEIRVEGVLTEKLDFFAFLFGGGNTTYQSIRDAVAAAEADPNVKRMQFVVASPGGTVEGLFETLAVIDAAKKPMSVSASQATSAAYAISAVAGKIKATTPAALFGSIGVAASFLNLEEIVDITNTESPDKRPDVSTEEGRRIVQEELDGIFDVFVTAIAAGRGVSAKTVKDEYGRGRVFVASEAKKRGMIDAAPSKIVRGGRADDGGAAPVATIDVPADGPNTVTVLNETPPAQQETNAPAVSGGAQKPPQRSSKMDENQFKNEHPALYTQMREKFRAEGASEAVATERDRVESHLHAGEESGDMKTAVEAIRAGDQMTQKHVSRYMMASAKRQSVTARQEDSDKATKVIEGAAPAPEPTEDFGDKVVAARKSMKGGF